MISVIMLTFNREKLVARAIKSICSQIFRDFEFIIVDNGSSDGSGRIADGYARHDARIKVVHRERGNIGIGRNTGLDIAKGEYIAFIDDDDWVEPDFLEFLYSLVMNHDADVGICGAANQVCDQQLIMSPEEAVTELLWRRRYSAAFPTKLFHRDLFSNHRFPEHGIFDDIVLLYKVLAEARRITYHGLAKYTFYRHENNNSAWTTDHKLLTPGILDEYLHAYRQRTDWLCRRFPGRRDLWEYFEWSFWISMVEKVARLDLVGCESRSHSIKERLHRHRDEFIRSQYIQDFEKAWLNKYL